MPAAEFTGRTGAGLIELLVSMAVALTLFLAIFSGLYQVQVWTANLSLLVERDANLWILPALFAGWIPPAGNNRFETGVEGVSIASGRLSLASDIDGAGGLPDGRHESSFEAIAFRRKEQTLQILSGKGSFQPLANGIDSFLPRREDDRLITLRLRSKARRGLLLTARTAAEEVELSYALPNYRPNLFAEHLP